MSDKLQHVLTEAERNFQVLEEVRQQHPEETPEQQEARTRYRIEQHVDRRPPKKAEAASRAFRLPWWVIAWGIAVLVLLGAIAAKADERDERLRLIHRVAADALAPPPPSGVILQFRNQNTILATRPAGLVILNCSTNMACSFSGSTFSLTASSTASTAFSALTASLNTNAGTFSASGNSWDFTAATLFKVRAGAGCTTSANGDLCFDSTANRWKAWQTADRSLIASTNVGVLGQAFLSNADGSGTFADPIVSGPTAIGAAPATNPVFVAGYDGTNIRAHQLLNAAPAGTEYGLVTRNIPSGTQPVSIAAAIDVSDRVARKLGQAFLRNPGDTANMGDATTPVRTDPTGTTPQPVTCTAANCPMNVAQINGVTPLMGNGVTGTGSPRTTLSSDNTAIGNWGQGATGSAVPSGAQFIGGRGSGAAGAPVLTGPIFCDNWTNITQTAGAQLITGVASKQTYICNLFIFSATAQNLALVEGTGTVCATGIAGLMGGTTAATGQNLAANQGFVLPASTVPWRKTATAADNVCLLQSGTGQVSGVIVWSQF